MEKRGGAKKKKKVETELDVESDIVFKGKGGVLRHSRGRGGFSLIKRKDPLAHEKLLC